MISLHGVRKSYDGGKTYAVKGVDLHVATGEFLALLGESGSGKTTTLKIINRLVDSFEGTVEIDGEDTRALDPVALRRRVGYVFQGIGLFPHLTIAENVAIVPRLLGWPKHTITARLTELFALVNLPRDTYHDRFPATLSGGQQQRVGLARALAARPKIMLMDEPFGALDPLTRDALQDEFRHIHREQGLTTVMVTHDITEALLMADRVAVMSDGWIVDIATPHEMLASPRHPYVEEIMAMPRRLARRIDDLAAEHSVT